MKIDRALRIIWLIIGILLLVILPYSLYQLAKNSFRSDYDEGIDQSLVVGNEQRDALRKGKLIQGLLYDQIEIIRGTPYYVLPVSAKRFENPKDVGEFLDAYASDKVRAGDLSLNNLLGNVSIIFLDSNYNVINSIPKEKAYIKDYKYGYSDYGYDRYNQIDPSIKNIVYEIAFKDTNNDGLLNEFDDLDLYISDVTGDNLRNVTKDVDLIEYEFKRNNTELLIGYYERDTIPDDYKRKLFARYIIGEKSLIELESLHREILELEKRLVVDTLVTQ